ncbi:hypothetical protein LPJ57_004851 [Coemansia sp. RSA 486]|nr:hypothetical protein LPJ57_004851 [Coemansia sp. RSA 486]
MGNGMYCDIESYCDQPSEEEKLYLDSRKTLDYLKSAHSRLLLLMKQLNFYRYVVFSIPFGICRQSS